MNNGKLFSKEVLKKRSLNGVKALKVKRLKFWFPYTPTEIAPVYAVMNGASQRCNNSNSRSFNNYGGRGIAFCFANPSDATKWVLDNLGPRPSKEHSIDRIDNNKHYEPGNLRWATREEQNRNKRAYKKRTNGEIIRRVLLARSDLSYECVRNWVAQGYTEEEIINRRKYARSSI